MKLFCNGIELNDSPDKLGELRHANDLLDDTAALRERMREDGYLLLRDFVDSEIVAAARREILLKFATVGEIDSIRHPVMDAIRQDETFVDQVNLLAFTESLRTGMAFNALVESKPIISLFERFLGGAVRCFDFKWIRFIRPGENTGIHADIVYVGRGTRNVWSAWVPIGDVPREEGSLIVLEGSHRSPRLKAYCDKDADRDKLGWLADDPVKLQETIGGRWLTADFRAGDFLCFSACLAHATLDNRSPVRRCRLTADVRYQLASEACDERWNGEDVSQPHGGPTRAFLPGFVRANANREFEEEWKLVDATGRLAKSAEAASS